MGAPGSPLGAVHGLVTFGGLPFAMTFAAILVAGLELPFFPRLLLVEFGRRSGLFVAAAAAAAAAAFG